MFWTISNHDTEVYYNKMLTYTDIKSSVNIIHKKDTRHKDIPNVFYTNTFFNDSSLIRTTPYLSNSTFWNMFYFGLCYNSVKVGFFIDFEFDWNLIYWFEIMAKSWQFLFNLVYLIEKIIILMFKLKLNFKMLCSLLYILNFPRQYTALFVKT